MVKEAKKKSKRRKRPRREDQAQGTNTVDTKENNDVDRKQQETDNEPAMETDEAKVSILNIFTITYCPAHHSR